MPNLWLSFWLLCDSASCNVSHADFLISNFSLFKNVFYTQMVVVVVATMQFFHTRLQLASERFPNHSGTHRMWAGDDVDIDTLKIWAYSAVFSIPAAHSKCLRGNMQYYLLWLASDSTMHRINHIFWIGVFQYVLPCFILHSKNVYFLQCCLYESCDFNDTSALGFVASIKSFHLQIL